MILPSPLQPGDPVGLFCPAAPVSRETLRAAAARIAALGFEPVVPVTGTWRYLAGTDGERAAAFGRLLRDPAVRAFVAVRGGYGTARLLGRVDLSPLVADPRPVVGFSDLTSLHAALQRLGLVSFHGPMPGAAWSPWSAARLKEALTRPLLPDPLPWPEGYRPDPLVPGKATGLLVGGNLTVLAATLGTPYEPPWEEAVLLLEDVGEAPYRVDRLLTHLRAAGILTRVRGIVVGDLLPPRGSDPEVPLREVAAERLGDLGVPVLAGFPSGHGPEQLTLPLGVPVCLDADRGTLRVVGPHLAC